MLSRLQVRAEASSAAAASAGPSRAGNAVAANAETACGTQGAEQLVPASERGTLQGSSGCSGAAERPDCADAHVRKGNGTGAAAAACSGAPDPSSASAISTGGGSAGRGGAPARIPLVDAVYSVLSVSPLRDVLRYACARHDFS